MFEGSNIHLSPVDGKRLCSFSQKICKQHRLNGYAFCIRHILEDVNAPFKQCQYKMKANGEPCCNAVPVSEDRIYCNSHLQVLGLAPKTIPKKVVRKVTEPASISASSKGSGNLKNTSSKIIKKIKNQKLQKKKRAQILLMNKKMKKKTVRKITERKSTTSKEKIIDEFWQTTLANDLKNIEKYNKVWREKVLHQDLEGFRKIKKQKNHDYLLGIYHIRDDSDSESEEGDYIYQSELLVTPERAYHNDLHSDNVVTQERKVINKLRHQNAQLKQAFVAKKARPDISYSVLKHLIKATKQDPTEAANIINVSKNPKTFPISRDTEDKYSYKIPCCIQNKKYKCTHYALPFTKYCVKHILHDEEQLLYFKPSPINLKTPTNVHGVTYTFLCNATPKVTPKKKVATATKETKSTPSEAKRRKRRQSEESDHNSSLNESGEKTNSDYTSDSSDDDSDEDDADDLTPEEAFHLPPGTLSGYPSMNQIDEDSFSVLQSRNLDFEDDEDEELIRCSTKSFENITPRDLSTSPTLNQLSASHFENNLYLSQGSKSTGRASIANPMNPVYQSSHELESELTVDKEEHSSPNSKLSDGPIEKVNPDIFFSSVYPVPTKEGGSSTKEGDSSS